MMLVVIINKKKCTVQQLKFLIGGQIPGFLSKEDLK